MLEGQQVRPGDTLFTLSSERLSAAGATQQLIAEQLEQRLRLLARDRVLAADRLQEQLRTLESDEDYIMRELNIADMEQVSGGADWERSVSASAVSPCRSPSSRPRSA